MLLFFLYDCYQSSVYGWKYSRMDHVKFMEDRYKKKIEVIPITIEVNLGDS